MLRSPKNIEVWAQLRTYLQSQKVLELRWVEAAVGLVAVCSISFIVGVLVGTFQVRQQPVRMSRIAPIPSTPGA